MPRLQLFSRHDHEVRQNRASFCPVMRVESGVTTDSRTISGGPRMAETEHLDRRVVEAHRHEYRDHPLLRTGQVAACSRAKFGGYRIYGDSHLKRLNFVRRARALGFSIGEVRTLL